MDSKELTKLGRTDASQPLVVGNEVYDPLVFEPEVIRFSRKQYIFLNAYRMGTSLEEAAAKANMLPDAAERFLTKDDTVKWLRDRALMDHIKTEWEEPAKWWAMGNEVLEGKRDFSKAQTEVWKDFGRRIAPAASEHGSGSRIEIHINPAAVQEAFRRNAAIDGQIVKEQPGNAA